MDRASFHRKKQLEGMCVKAKVTLMFLPACSPDFNPTEKDRANMKNALRDTAPLCDLLQTAVYDYWRQVFLSRTTIKDILLAARDGLTGFPDAVAAVFPRTEVRLCMVHMVRNPVRFIPYKDRKAVIAGLRNIYLSPSEELAAVALDEFAEVWDTKYPMIAKSWRSRWNEIIPFFKFSPEIRKAVYTTNAIESVN
jgi:transposase-like protein